jgi:hypothetical protein
MLVAEEYADLSDREVHEQVGPTDLSGSGDDVREERGCSRGLRRVAAHAVRGQAEAGEDRLNDLRSTGGNGLFYCFARP